VGRAGIEPATLGLRGGCGDLGRLRFAWSNAAFGDLEQFRVSVDFGGLCCPRVVPGQSVLGVQTSESIRTLIEQALEGYGGYGGTTRRAAPGGVERIGIAASLAGIPDFDTPGLTDHFATIGT
jgi:hypothetical protein